MTGENCGHETSCIDGKKSYCSKYEMWTNCRQHGSCTLERHRKEHDAQLAMEVDE